MQARDWRGKRVTVWGLGRFGGGVAVARWLHAQGADVLVSDQADEDALQQPIAALHDVPVRWELGGHNERSFTDCDAVVVNPAVPEHAALLATAREAGVALTTEINEFLLRCPGTVIGVTGTVGKSTTCAMITQLLQAHTQRRVWMGGNVGRSLLGALSEMTPDDLVVLELSSFQLQRTAWIRWSPHIALLTNIAPNHLDWHETYAAYVAAKLNLVRFQEPGRDKIVMPEVTDLRESIELMFGDLAGVWRFRVDGAQVHSRCQTNSAVESPDVHTSWQDVAVGVPGTHNLQNAAAALTTVHALELGHPVRPDALSGFNGLPDRLERVPTEDGLHYYNDSKASTPEAALTAIDAFDAPPVVIVGGYDKGVDLATFAAAVAQRTKFAACIGATGLALHEAITAAGGNSVHCGTLEQAVPLCRVQAGRGDAVLLSPACASWDQFADYRARGEAFRTLVTEPA